VGLIYTKEKIPTRNTNIYSLEYENDNLNSSALQSAYILQITQSKQGRLAISWNGPLESFVCNYITFQRLRASATTSGNAIMGLEFKKTLWFPYWFHRKIICLNDFTVSELEIQIGIAHVGSRGGWASARGRLGRLNDYSCVQAIFLGSEITLNVFRMKQGVSLAPV